MPYREVFRFAIHYTSISPADHYHYLVMPKFVYRIAKRGRFAVRVNVKVRGWNEWTAKLELVNENQLWNFKNRGEQIVSRGLCLSGSWYNDHSQHLQHPEPSGSFSQDFNLPIQAMMNPVVFWDNRELWTYAVNGLACSAHSEGT